jgi:hypothetical protein
MKSDSLFDSNQGLEGVISSEDDSSRRMSQSASIAPANCQNRDLFDQITISSHNLDKLITQALQPNTDNKSVLSPSLYQILLNESIHIFRTKSNETGNPGYAHCADLIQNETTLLEMINMQRNRT